MAKQCGKCHGTGWWGSRFDIGSNARGGPCRACNGTGYDQRWGTTHCKHCGNTIDYRYDWSNIPEYCQSCRQPKYSACKGCGRLIEYKVYWSSIPEYCRECKEWKIKSCKGCGAEIRYKSYWERVPEICQQCKKMASRRGVEEICAGTEMEKWLPGRRGEKVVVDGDDFHVTLYVDGEHISGNVHRYSTRLSKLHVSIHAYNEKGERLPKMKDIRISRPKDWDG